VLLSVAYASRCLLRCLPFLSLQSFEDGWLSWKMSHYGMASSCTALHRSSILYSSPQQGDAVEVSNGDCNALPQAHPCPQDHGRWYTVGGSIQEMPGAWQDRSLEPLTVISEIFGALAIHVLATFTVRYFVYTAASRTRQKAPNENAPMRRSARLSRGLSSS
jgi:hypothetical protein